MSLNIEHYPNHRFELFPFPDFTIDLNESVKKQLKRGETLTNTTALKIFKEIKSKSDILSFLTKPITLISLGASISAFGILMAALCPPFVAPVFIVITILIGILGAKIFAYSILNYVNDFLPELSRAYADQSEKAAEYIRILEASNQELVFKLV